MSTRSRRNRPYGVDGPSGPNARASAVRSDSGSAKSLADARRKGNGRPPSATTITRAVSSSS